MSEELRPCPFCGGEAQVNTWTLLGITESRCFCSNSGCPNSVRTVALEQWNTRPIEDGLHARIAELEYQLEDWTNNGWAEDYKARIAELEAEQARWIPVGERLPDEGGRVYVMLNNKWGAIAYWFPIKGGLAGMWKNDCGQVIHNVTHWMPLPEAPEVEE